VTIAFTAEAAREHIYGRGRLALAGGDVFSGPSGKGTPPSVLAKALRANVIPQFIWSARLTSADPTTKRPWPQNAALEGATARCFFLAPTNDRRPKNSRTASSRSPLSPTATSASPARLTVIHPAPTPGKPSARPEIGHFNQLAATPWKPWPTAVKRPGPTMPHLSTVARAGEFPVLPPPRARITARNNATSGCSPPQFTQSAQPTQRHDSRRAGAVSIRF